MQLWSKASTVVESLVFPYAVTGFTQNYHSIPVAANCTVVREECGHWCPRVSEHATQTEPGSVPKNFHHSTLS